MEVTMKRKIYTAEFKREAVRLSEQPGASVLKVAKDLGVSSHSLYAWQKASKEQGKLAFPGHGKVALSAEQEENRRLKKELELVKQERDILKKAVGFFARESK
jgi:transposase